MITSQCLLHKFAVNEGWKSLFYLPYLYWRFISPIVLAVGIGIVLEIVRWSIMITATLLMVASSHTFRKYDFALLINISGKTTLTPTLRTGIAVANPVFLKMESILAHKAMHLLHLALYALLHSDGTKWSFHCARVQEVQSANGAWWWFYFCTFS